MAKSAAFRAKLIPCAEELEDLIPRLPWRLEELERLELESLQGVGNVSFEETGLPFNLAAQLRRAISDAAPGIEWHWDFISDPSARNPLPTARTTHALAAPTLVRLYSIVIESEVPLPA